MWAPKGALWATPSSPSHPWGAQGATLGGAATLRSHPRGADWEVLSIMGIDRGHRRQGMYDSSLEGLIRDDMPVGPDGSLAEKKRRHTYRIMHGPARASSSGPGMQSMQRHERSPKAVCKVIGKALRAGTRIRRM
ncbi:hypothetical protein GOP47_0002803 [Adiantum capillus-veneris]|uniref:Uncharacterized protein n=1 Tax=Adiantum capillus-veneris TaxID=13818 RepID=A0A9D4VBL9_ADICA|nr:hypothetical protein GOP47_0002803 [Adiantum capillus-veneris]